MLVIARETRIEHDYEHEHEKNLSGPPFEAKLHPPDTQIPRDYAWLELLGV